MANLLGGSQKDLGGSFTNAGQVVWSGGTISILNNCFVPLFGNIENQPNGTWGIQGDLSISQPVVNSYAAFRNPLPVEEMNCQPKRPRGIAFLQSRTIKQRSGALDFGRDLSLYAGVVAVF